MSAKKESKDNEEQLLRMIKTILTNSNVLEEVLAEKQESEQPPGSDVKPPLSVLRRTSLFSEESLCNMAKKIQNILKSEEFNTQVENIVRKKWMRMLITPKRNYVVFKTDWTRQNNTHEETVFSYMEFQKLKKRTLMQKLKHLPGQPEYPNHWP